MTDDRTTYPFRAGGEPVTSDDAGLATPLLPTTDPFEAAARAFEHPCTECGAPAAAVHDGRPVCVACKITLSAPAQEDADELD